MIFITCCVLVNWWKVFRAVWPEGCPRVSPAAHSTPRIGDQGKEVVTRSHSGLG